ncbi:MAG: tyrosine-type recombinase/integrase [Erysipelotrichaceae bacterium]|nr:tyrosine-type recombinase/integrase [Erysipelotrichaceae bacterium]
MYTESLPALIERAKKRLYELGFTESTVEREYWYIWKRLLKDIGDVENVSLEDLYRHCESYYGRNIILEDHYLLTADERRIKRVLLELLYFKEYDQFHNVPLFRNADLLDGYSISLINEYLEYLRENGLRDTTLVKKNSTLSLFLKTCRIEDLCEETVLEYIASRTEGKDPYASRLTINAVKRFLIFLKSKGYIEDDYERLFPVHPITSRGSISSYYSDDEIKILIEYAGNKAGDCAKRDFAILLLLVYYGLRARDIALLTKDNIDWDNSKLKIITSKTKTELEYPLFPAVGNAIIDYLLNERPEVKSDHIFLKKNGENMASVNITGLINKLFKDSKINTANKHYGPHSLRSSLATRMMNQNESIFTISKVLGHASIDTTKIYTKVDIEHLRLCALEVPHVL